METVLICYFLIALAAFGMWFIVFLNDSTTPLTDRTSWVVLVLASLCWPITIPTSIAKLTSTGNKAQSVSIEK